MMKTETTCLFCNRDASSLIDKRKNLYYCHACSSTFFIDRKNTNNLQSKINYFESVLSRLSYNIPLNKYGEVDATYLPKQKGNIINIFYQQNKGEGLTCEERENIIYIYTRYVVFLQKNSVFDYSSSIKLLLHSIINLNVTDKTFFIKTKEKLPLWYQFLKTIKQKKIVYCGGQGEMLAMNGGYTTMVKPGGM